MGYAPSLILEYSMPFAQSRGLGFDRKHTHTEERLQAIQVLSDHIHKL
jgi:hypothetical protein